jgi:hypothetical protein
MTYQEGPKHVWVECRKILHHNKVYNFCLIIKINTKQLNYHFNKIQTMDPRHAVAQWLRHCASNRKVAGSILDGVIGFCSVTILLVALWSWGRLRLLTEMSTRSISWGKGGRCVRLTTLPPSCADCLKTFPCWT